MTLCRKVSLAKQELAHHQAELKDLEVWKHVEKYVFQKRALIPLENTTQKEKTLFQPISERMEVMHREVWFWPSVSEGFISAACNCCQPSWQAVSHLLCCHKSQ